MSLVWSYLISFALGGLVSLGEVISRYRDRPVAALKTPGAFVYLALTRSRPGPAKALDKAANRFNMFELRPADTTRLAAVGEVDGPPMPKLSAGRGRAGAGFRPAKPDA